MTDQNVQSLLLGKIAAYTEILVKDPNSTIFVSLAETYRKMGMLDDARQIITKGLTLHSNFGPAYIVLGRILCQLDDFDGSVTAFEHALSLDSESLAALVGYARVRILLGDETAARELLLKARSLSPADPVINKLLLSLPEPTAVNEPVEPVDDAVADNEDDAVCEPPPALISTTLAELYLEQGLSEKALDIYRQLSQQNPDDLSLRRRLKELEGVSVEQTVESVAAEVEEITEDRDEEVAVSGSAAVNVTVNDTIVETLNGWLSNIQRRRDHV